MSTLSRLGCLQPTAKYLRIMTDGRFAVPSLTFTKYRPGRSRKTGPGHTHEETVRNPGTWEHVVGFLWERTGRTCTCCILRVCVCACMLDVYVPATIGHVSWHAEGLRTLSFCCCRPRVVNALCISLLCGDALGGARGGSQYHGTWREAGWEARKPCGARHPTTCVCRERSVRQRCGLEISDTVYLRRTA